MEKSKKRRKEKSINNESGIEIPFLKEDVERIINHRPDSFIREGIEYNDDSVHLKSLSML